MKLSSLFGFWRYGGQAISRIKNSPRALREFVYLDEVSLRSLLSSQTGEVTETRSEQQSDGSQFDVSGSTGFKVPGITKADVTSRYQTSNSSSLQTSRKATVQSWFGELHAISGLRLVEPRQAISSQTCVEDLLKVDDRSVVAASSELTRGTLVEFNVRLSADPVFHLGTMVSEFSSLVEESPEVFSGSDISRQLNEFHPINNALQRMLAGLVPIRCEALDHVVIKINDMEYVVHRSSIVGLDIAHRPLQIVGVTEHVAYWKDLRRVLFSNAEFTIMGRLARTGIQTNWSAIKLGDLFRVVAPDWDNKINTTDFASFVGSSGGVTVNISQIQLGEALRYYRDEFLEISAEPLSAEHYEELQEEIFRLQSRAMTVSDQRSAFNVVHDFLVAKLGAQVEPKDTSSMRMRAREASGLSLFPSKSHETVTIGGESAPTDLPAPGLLDIEVVAIYW